MVEITILGGLIGGLLATIVMTMVMMTLGDDSPPPTAVFVAKYLGDDEPEAYKMPGMAMHLFYGTAAGIVLAAVLPLVGLGSLMLTTAIGVGLASGVVLFVGAAAFWMKVVLALDRESGGFVNVYHSVDLDAMREDTLIGFYVWAGEAAALIEEANLTKADYLDADHEAGLETVFWEEFSGPHSDPE